MMENELVKQVQKDYELSVGWEKICQGAFNGCEGAKDIYFFDNYCIKEDSKSCDYQG